MRLAKRIAFTIMVIVVLAVAAVHINAEVFRWRVARLLNLVGGARLEATPYSSVSALQNQYVANVIEKQACTEQHCEFSINLAEWDYLIHLTWKHPWTDRPRYYTVLLLRHFGLRPTEFGVWFRIDRGILTGLGVELMPVSVIEHREYAPNGFLSNFFVTAKSAGNFRRLLYRSSIYKHPNLIVWEPSACTGCSGAITAEFTWQASQQELDKALDFNLSCLTRFRDCKLEEYLPSAAELVFSDGKEYVSWDSIPCDGRMAHILGRDSDFVDIVRLKKLRPSDNDNFVFADYEVLKPLKGRALQLAGIYQPKKLVNGTSRRTLQVGDESILFLSQMLGRPTPESHCAVTAPTADALKATLDGIADDRSGSSEDE